MESNNNRIGSRLRTARMAHGLSQRELAEKIGAHKNSISGWEKHGIFPREYTDALIHVLELPEDFFDNPYGEFEQAVLEELAYIRKAIERQALLVSELDRLVQALEAKDVPEPKQAG